MKVTGDHIKVGRAVQREGVLQIFVGTRGVGLDDNFLGWHSLANEISLHHLGFSASGHDDILPAPQQKCALKATFEHRTWHAALDASSQYQQGD